MGTEPNQVPAAAIASSSTSSPSINSPTTSTRAPPRRRAAPNQANTQANVESRGVQVYDVLIMLLVAAIAALLARRINLMTLKVGPTFLLKNENNTKMEDCL